MNEITQAIRAYQQGFKDEMDWLSDEFHEMTLERRVEVMERKLRYLERENRHLYQELRNRGLVAAARRGASKLRSALRRRPK